VLSPAVALAEADDDELPFAELDDDASEVGHTTLN